MRVCKSEKPEKTFKGFRRYICWIRTYVRNTKASLERAIVLSQDDYDVYAFCLHVIEQDEMFYQQLTTEEIEALNYWRYHNPVIKKPILLDFYLKTAYSKYLDVFFSEPEPKISLKVLGKMMKLLRKEKGRTKTELAEILGVDRTTIGYYERGSRTPSIIYFSKFCKYFGCVMDELMDAAIR